LLNESEDESLRRQVRGALDAVGALKNPSLLSRVNATSSHPTAIANAGIKPHTAGMLV